MDFEEAEKRSRSATWSHRFSEGYAAKTLGSTRFLASLSYRRILPRTPANAVVPDLPDESHRVTHDAPWNVAS
jgi:hypothetical protein